MSNTISTPWLQKTYSADIEQSASNLKESIDRIEETVSSSTNWDKAYDTVANNSAKWESEIGLVSTDSSIGIVENSKVYDLSVSTNLTDRLDGLETSLGSLGERLDTVESDLATETVARETGDKSSRTELVEGDNVNIAKVVGTDGQDVYTVSTQTNEVTYEDSTVANGAFKARNDGQTSELLDVDGKLIGYLMPDIGTKGKVLMSTGSATTWSDAGGSGSSNILVVTYGDTTVTLADMQTYDTVLMRVNDKTFYLTEVNDTSAHFMSSYPIASKTQIETCSYDGSTWSEIETVSFGEGTIVLTCNQTPTQTFDELVTAASNGLLYALRYNVIFPAKFWSGTKIGFYSAINSRIDGWEYDASKGWSNSTFAIQTKLTAGDGITLDTSGNISATGNGKVASQEGQTPDYLGNVLVSDTSAILLTGLEDGKLHIQSDIGDIMDKSATWDSVYDTVNTNSATWVEDSGTVHYSSTTDKLVANSADLNVARYMENTYSDLLKAERIVVCNPDGSAGGTIDSQLDLAGENGTLFFVLSATL